MELLTLHNWLAGAFHDESGALSFWWERGSFVRLRRTERCLARRHASDPAEALLDQVALQAAYAVCFQYLFYLPVRVAICEWRTRKAPQRGHCAEESNMPVYWPPHARASQMYKQRQSGLRLAALPDASSDQLFSLAFATVRSHRHYARGLL